MQIVISLILLSFLILIHELGHLWGAKLFKVKVREFSIFMGPKLFSFKTKKTEYSVRAIPIGGYVAMEGETEQSDDSDALMNKPKWQQAVIMFSGAFMNLIFGLLAFFILTTSYGYISSEISDTTASVPDFNIYIRDESMKYSLISPAQAAGLRDGDRIISYDGRKVVYPLDVLIFSMESKDREIEIGFERGGEKMTAMLKPVIIPSVEIYKMGVYFASQGEAVSTEVLEVTPGSAAEASGIKAGDRIISIDDTLVYTRDDISAALAASGGEAVRIKLLSGGSEIDVQLTPQKVLQEEYPYIGLYFRDGSTGFSQRAAASLRYFASIVKSVYYSVIWLISGKVSIREAMGPVGIVSTIGSVVASKDTFANIFRQLLSLLGLISVNLGFINLLPFPALDGSKLAILGIEAVTRKRIPIEKQATISFIGFALLIIMLIAITSLDIMRLFGK